MPSDEIETGFRPQRKSVSMYGDSPVVSCMVSRNGSNGRSMLGDSRVRIVTGLCCAGYIRTDLSYSCRTKAERRESSSGGRMCRHRITIGMPDLGYM